jgi:hypothetical protein
MPGPRPSKAARVDAEFPYGPENLALRRGLCLPTNKGMS